MISIRPQGGYFKIGLNLCFARDHIAVHWAWYDFARHEGWHKGFTISRKGLRRRSARWNVIDSYLRIHDLEAVSAEVLRDLRAAESDLMAVIEPWAVIKP